MNALKITREPKSSLLVRFDEKGTRTLFKKRDKYKLIIRREDFNTRISSLKGKFSIDFIPADILTADDLDALDAVHNHSVNIVCIDRIPPLLSLRFEDRLPKTNIPYPNLKDCSWRDFFLSFSKGLEHLDTLLADEYASGKTIYPPKENIFEALRLTPPAKIKVILIGQDPYHRKGEAHGLAFSCQTHIPPSLRNVYEELKREGFSRPATGDLTEWALKGVLCLNTSLTVVEGRPNSHMGIWRPFTEHLLQFINSSPYCQRIVVMAWGKHAEDVSKVFLKNPHISVIVAGHPSPLNTAWPFIGSSVFSKANTKLRAWGFKNMFN